VLGSPPPDGLCAPRCPGIVAGARCAAPVRVPRLTFPLRASAGGGASGGESRAAAGRRAVRAAVRNRGRRMMGRAAGEVSGPRRPSEVRVGRGIPAPARPRPQRPGGGGSRGAPGAGGGCATHHLATDFSLPGDVGAQLRRLFGTRPTIPREKAPGLRGLDSVAAWRHHHNRPPGKVKSPIRARRGGWRPCRGRHLTAAPPRFRIRNPDRSKTRSDSLRISGNLHLRTACGKVRIRAERR